MEKEEKLILKHALINAKEFSGKANPKAVLGKVLAENQKLKKDIGKIGKLVAKTVKDVNKWKAEKQEKELKKFGEIKKPEKKEREGLPELTNAKMGKVVTRFAPEPNGYLHLGHLKSAFLSYLYAKKYKGKMILRFEDTNPRRERKEYYGIIREDLKTFGIKPDKEAKMSDHMETFYEKCFELIKKKKFYVCVCAQDKIREMRYKGEKCACRKNTIKKNKELWGKMLGGKLKEGEAVVRMRTDPKHPNPALREPSMLRIVNVPHPLLGEKYRVYPMYNFACTIMDNLLGITHVMRDKGFENDARVQEFLYGLFGWKIPEIIQFGRIKSIAGIPMKKRKIIEMIKEGKLKSFEDLRIPNPRNLMKRGFKPEALRKLMEEIGPSKVDIDISMNKIETFNRQIIDKTSNRYFFVGDPVGIVLDRLVERSVKAPIYPGKRKYRKIPTSKKMFVDKMDFVANRGKEVRLMHFCNIILDKKAKVTGKTNKDIQKIHWLGSKNVKVKLIMPTGKAIEGLAEPEIKNVEVDKTYQFERLGFVRCDQIKPEIIFYYGHR